MTLVFLKFSPKITQIRDFGSKYENKAFLVKNTPKQHFWSQIQIFLFLNKNLQLDKFEGVDFKYDNSFLKFQPKNNKIRHFWSQNQAFSLFQDILQLDKFKGADFKYDNSFFKKILAQKHSNKVFLVPNLGVFVSSQNFTIALNRSC